MPWGWAKRGPAEPVHGGSRGTPEEAKIAHAWPKYEAAFLKDRLNNGGGKYGPTGAVGDVAEYVYYDKISEDYKSEADENLRKEFNDWLQGQHVENVMADAAHADSFYPKGDDLNGKPRRRAVYRNNNQVPGQELTSDWQPTYWGKKQLTHLPGVREYLRDGFQDQEQAELQMNMLAEHGPQNIEQAWMYFKHWVKGRPVSLEKPLYVDNTFDNIHTQRVADASTIGRRSDFRHQPPGDWPDAGRSRPPVRGDDSGGSTFGTPRSTTGNAGDDDGGYDDGGYDDDDGNDDGGDNDDGGYEEFPGTEGTQDNGLDGSVNALFVRLEGVMGTSIRGLVGAVNSLQSSLEASKTDTTSQDATAAQAIAIAELARTEATAAAAEATRRSETFEQTIRAALTDAENAKAAEREARTNSAADAARVLVAEAEARASRLQAANAAVLHEADIQAKEAVHLQHIANVEQAQSEYLAAQAATLQERSRLAGVEERLRQQESAFDERVRVSAGDIERQRNALQQDVDSLRRDLSSARDAMQTQDATNRQQTAVIAQGYANDLAAAQQQLAAAQRDDASNRASATLMIQNQTAALAEREAAYEKTQAEAQSREVRLVQLEAQAEARLVDVQEQEAVMAGHAEVFMAELAPMQFGSALTYSIAESAPRFLTGPPGSGSMQFGDALPLEYFATEDVVPEDPQPRRAKYRTKTTPTKDSIRAQEREAARERASARDYRYGPRTKTTKTKLERQQMKDEKQMSERSARTQAMTARMQAMADRRIGFPKEERLARIRASPSQSNALVSMQPQSTEAMTARMQAMADRQIGFPKEAQSTALVAA